jgi:hypothetical protein
MCFCTGMKRTLGQFAALLRVAGWEIVSELRFIDGCSIIIAINNEWIFSKTVF